MVLICLSFLPNKEGLLWGVSEEGLKLSILVFEIRICFLEGDSSLSAAECIL